MNITDPVPGTVHFAFEVDTSLRQLIFFTVTVVVQKLNLMSTYYVLITFRSSTCMTSILQKNGGKDRLNEHSKFMYNGGESLSGLTVGLAYPGSL